LVFAFEEGQVPLLPNCQYYCLSDAAANTISDTISPKGSTGEVSRPEIVKEHLKGSQIERGNVGRDGMGFWRTCTQRAGESSRKVLTMKNISLKESPLDGQVQENTDFERQ